MPNLTTMPCPPSPIPPAQQRRCQVQAGLCGVVPDRPVLHFAVSSSAAAGSNNATTPGVAAAPVSAPVPPQQSYIVYPGTHVPYDAAAEMCRSSNYMGLAWRLVAARVSERMSC